MFPVKLHFYLILFYLLSTLFLGFSFLVVTGQFTKLDHSLEQTMTVSSSSLWFWGSWILAYFYLPLIVLLLGLFGYFLYRRQYFEAKLLIVCFLGWAFSEFFLKPFFQISCPSSNLGQFYSLQEIFNLPFLHSYALKYPCYPSGHTVGYIIFFGYLALLASVYIKNKVWRWLVYTIIIGVVVLIGPSRVYLHVHWLSDVIAGYLLGAAILTGLILVRYKHDQGLRSLSNRSGGYKD